MAEIKTINFPDGSFYEGEMKDELFHGKGFFKDSNFEYVGEFENGIFEGHGEIKYLDGTKYIGDFEKGEESYGTLLMSNGNKYEGEWKCRTWYGKGNLEFKDIHGNKKKYIGYFENGMMHGKGQITEADGIVYEGEFINNRKNGIFILIDNEGGRREVFFKDDKIQY
tara:strand:- start:8320 stop:8820 length:501 start_codon:yes stop_codon:yes gene_type:complete